MQYYTDSAIFRTKYRYHTVFKYVVLPIKLKVKIIFTLRYVKIIFTLRYLSHPHSNLLSSLLPTEDSRLLWGWERFFEELGDVLPRDTMVMQTNFALNGHWKGCR